MKVGIALSKPAPCLKCDNRWVDAETGRTCHSECAAYLAYRAESGMSGTGVTLRCRIIGHSASSR